MKLMSKLIETFIRVLSSIPPSEEYISDKSRRYWLTREYMDRMNGRMEG